MKMVDLDQIEGGKDRSIGDWGIPSVLSVSSVVRNRHFHHSEQIRQAGKLDPGLRERRTFTRAGSRLSVTGSISANTGGNPRVLQTLGWSSQALQA
jgi:hypothetical protein